MMCNNPKLVHVNINAHTEFGYKRVLKILSGNEIMTDGQTDGQTDGMTDNPNSI